MKSSLGPCTVTMTSREWQQARAHGRDYVLAIIEYFDPGGQNIIYWVPDPCGACAARPATTVNYSVARSSRQAAAVALAAL